MIFAKIKVFLAILSLFLKLVFYLASSKKKVKIIFNYT